MADKTATNPQKEKLDTLAMFQDFAKQQHENMLNPYQQGVMKGLIKAGQQHATEALQQGVPADHIVQQSGVSLNPIQQQASNIVNPQGGPHPLKALLDFAGNMTGINAASTAINSVKLGNLEKAQDIISGQKTADKESLIRNRNLESDLMEKQLRGGDTTKVYRDPVTGQEVDQATAEEDMANGLGVYQVNQKVSTRAGVVERPLNKVPDLTEQEKQYVNQARLINNSLYSFENNLDKIYDKYGGGAWQSFQAEKLPYAVSSDQDVQNLKSDLVYLKAQIPFLRGGKQLTETEARRVDILLDPFGKSKSTYKKDIARFNDEFITGSDITKFGLNAGLMKRLVNSHRKKLDSNKSTSDENNSESQSNNLKSKYGLE